MNSLLTIGMPVFNDVQFIESSLVSILNQEFKEFVLIISDDGSTDGSEEICKRYASLDSRIHYIRQNKNLGISKNMEFLLAQANTPYFMWMGDDDIIASDFLQKLIMVMRSNPKAIVSFCTFAFIDESGKIIGTSSDFNYTNSNSYKRLFNFIINPSDVFGYGVFVTSRIKNVEFPIWWWPNKKTPFNNIFPSLCFYLAKGDYAHIFGNPLFFKREKTVSKTNYAVSISKNGWVDIFAFMLRRFYLICFSSKMILKGSNAFMALLFFPILFLYWFLISSCKEVIGIIKVKFGK